MKDLLLIGAGGHAQSVIDIVECKNEWSQILDCLTTRAQLCRGLTIYQLSDNARYKTQKTNGGLSAFSQWDQQ